MEERRGYGSQGEVAASGPVATGTTDRLLAALPGRSPNAATCPFLRVALDDDSFAAPIEEADYANRCAAIRDPVPLSLRQQELVCLTPSHVECARYVRGAVIVHERLAPPPERRRLSRPILGSAIVLGVSVALAFAFVVARGGLDLPQAPAVIGDVAAATGTPAPSPTLIALPSTPAAVPSPARTATPPAEPTPPATVAPTPPPPTATPTPPAPQTTPRPAPTSDRYQYLEPCPDQPGCWIYTIRYGDALFNLARYFGHSLDTVYQLNPWALQGIHPGDRLVLPPPTR